MPDRLSFFPFCCKNVISLLYKYLGEFAGTFLFVELLSAPRSCAPMYIVTFATPIVYFVSEYVLRSVSRSFVLVMEEAGSELFVVTGDFSGRWFISISQFKLARLVNNCVGLNML